MVATDAALSALRASSLFSRLPNGTLEVLARQAQMRRFADGERLVGQGEPASGLFIIGYGRVRVYRVSEDGQQATLEILGPGECLGELAVLDERPRSACAVAMEQVVTVYLPRQDFFQVLEDSSDAKWALIRLLCARLRRADDIVSSFVFNDVHGRVATRLLELARFQGISTAGGIEIDLNLTQRELASLVGATRESVNKILTFYRQTGQIAVRGQRIVILAPEALKRRSNG